MLREITNGRKKDKVDLETQRVKEKNWESMISKQNNKAKDHKHVSKIKNLAPKFLD